MNLIKYSEQPNDLRLYPQSEVLYGARLSSPLDLFTGYGYFGARYMDHELMTMWLSVDPMADKYPSISPYAYCAWNPVKLLDPDGDTIRIQDKNGQYRYVELSQISGFRNSKDPRENALFLMSNDAEGADILKGLSTSSVCYDIQNKSNIKGGRVDDDRIVVWGKPADNYGGTEENIILEELFHCAQYAGINNMRWTGDVETEEIPAKEFSARIYPYFKRYFNINGFWVSTEMNIMAGGYPGVDSFSQQDKLNFLTKITELPIYLSDPTKGVIQYHTQKYTSKPAY
ncbi:MAG: hypothetical protein J5848_00215 [Bacteroidales bacterium]|nr:hypothetical protein [Bacteroidales bacterium]